MPVPFTGARSITPVSAETTPYEASRTEPDQLAVSGKQYEGGRDNKVGSIVQADSRIGLTAPRDNLMESGTEGGSCSSAPENPAAASASCAGHEQTSALRKTGKRSLTQTVDTVVRCGWCDNPSSPEAVLGVPVTPPAT